MLGGRLCRQSRCTVPVIDREEPPLQAEIMIRSSITLSLILQSQSQRQPLLYIAVNLLAAPTLHNEDILVANGRLCTVVSGRGERCVVILRTDLYRRLAITKLA